VTQTWCDHFWYWMGGPDKEGRADAPGGAGILPASTCGRDARAPRGRPNRSRHAASATLVSGASASDVGSSWGW
jgi:hypothetical protein